MYVFYCTVIIRVFPLYKEYVGLSTYYFYIFTPKTQACHMHHFPHAIFK